MRDSNTDTNVMWQTHHNDERTSECSLFGLDMSSEIDKDKRKIDEDRLR